jgi:hypothetical protein
VDRALKAKRRYTAPPYSSLIPLESQSKRAGAIRCQRLRPGSPRGIVAAGFFVARGPRAFRSPIAVAPNDPLGFVAKDLGSNESLAPGRRAFSGLDTASSDLASAELEDAAGRLMEMVSAQIDVVLKHRTGS